MLAVFKIFAGRRLQNQLAPELIWEAVILDYTEGTSDYCLCLLLAHETSNNKIAG